MRYVVFVALCCSLLFAQETKPPKLPVITYDACPGEMCRFDEREATRTLPVYDKWQKGRKRIGTLNIGERVIVLTGVFIVFKPERVRRVRLGMDGRGTIGEEVLTYYDRGEGRYVAWVNGEVRDWVEGYATKPCEKNDPTFVVSAHDFCIVEPGQKEWWVKVKRESGQLGWVKRDHDFRDSKKISNLKKATQ